jgi:hypothetical protein
MSERVERQRPLIANVLDEGRGRRIAILVVALIVIGAVIAVVVSGFHGERIDSGARALTKPLVQVPAKPVSPSAMP